MLTHSTASYLLVCIGLDNRGCGGVGTGVQGTAILLILTSVQGAAILLILTSVQGTAILLILTCLHRP